MDSLTEMQREYLKRLREQELEKLSENAHLIESFKNKCERIGIHLEDKNFRYVQTIGIVAKSPNILNLLNENVRKDKEELVKVNLLNNVFDRRRMVTGFYFDKDYMVMAHPFFRRGFYEDNNWSPRFIELFWGFDLPQIESYISLDFDRVRINVDSTMYMELDTWHGASFNENISQINDGISKLRPPLDLGEIDISFFFKDAYSLDIKWETKDRIKTFQSEEFKTDKVKILFEGKEYYPVRYIHAEFDLDKNHFRHFDGAIHFYTEEEYFRRRESDFNYNSKNQSHIKTKSLKLFKMNGEIDVKTWVEFSSHFCSGNPLIIEYFEGEYPDHIKEIIEIRRKKPAANKVQNGK